MPQLPSAVTELLAPNLDVVVVASREIGTDTYYLIVQSNADIGGELLIKNTPHGAEVIKSDTTVFPLDESRVPAPVLEAFSPLVTDGPRQIEQYVLPVALPPDLSQEQLNSLVFIQARMADGTLHTNVPGTNGGALACAWAVNEIVQRALGKPIGGGLSTAAMYDVLRTSHAPVSEADAVAGTIIISPTMGNNHGHVGIVGQRNQVNQVGSTVIYSNRSSAALFGHSFTIDTWHEYFAGKGLPVLYFNLLPRVFVPVLASISAAAAWVPPGLNVVTDIYAGDARQPDFSAIRSAGIQAFIHKATDPIYAFNAQLYNARRAQALAAGLLWGSYHFGRSGDGAQQADNYLDAINPQDNEFVCLDFEKDQNRPDTVMSLSEAAVFIGRVQQRLGQPPFLYGGAYLRESLQGATANPLSACKLWFADYRQRPGPQIPALWNSWTLWQFAGDIPAGQPGSLPTLDNTDRSVFNGTNQQLKATWRCRPQPAG